MHTIKRILTSTILAIALATLAGGPALADTPPNAITGVPVAEWIFSPAATSVTPAQGYVSIASATFTTTASNFIGLPSGWPWPLSWSIDADASTVFQAQSSQVFSCIINISIPGTVPNTGAGVQGIATPNLALGAPATATATIRGVQLYAATSYTATASIAATGPGGSSCLEGSPPLVKFTLKVRAAP
jgi:hypothetical protein